MKLSEKMNMAIDDKKSTFFALPASTVSIWASEVAQLEEENEEIKREVARAVVELAQEDKWETPMKRLCKIASIEYPAIATKIEPTSIDVLLTAEKPTKTVLVYEGEEYELKPSAEEQEDE